MGRFQPNQLIQFVGHIFFMVVDAFQLQRVSMHEQHRMLFRLRKREIKLKMSDLFASGVCTNGAETAESYRLLWALEAGEWRGLSQSAERRWNEVTPSPS